MRIGELAKMTGLTVKTLRYYEARELLGEVPRRGRYREYDSRHLERIELIRHSKELGMTLAEIRQVVSSQPETATTFALSLVEGKIDQRREEIAIAQRQLRSLRAARRRILACLTG